MTTRVVPTTLIPDTPDGILDYLVARTSDTIGRKVELSDAVVVAEVEESGGHSLAVRPEDATVLGPWLSGEAGAAPHIMVYRTRARVEEWLWPPHPTGNKTNTIEIVYVPRWDKQDRDLLPLFNVHDRGLLFLRRLPDGRPYASYLSDGLSSYQLAAGETAIHSLSPDAETAEDLVKAVSWYASVPSDNPQRRRQQLIEAVAAAHDQSVNGAIVRLAIRELAECRAPGAAELFTSLLAQSAGETRVPLILGLWLLGERQAAHDALEQDLRSGREAFLASWGLRPSTSEAGEPSAVLFGPDPTVVKAAP